MGKDKGKKEAEAERNRAAAERAAMQAKLDAAIQVQQKPAPVEDKINTQNLSFLNAVEGKGDDGSSTPFDIRDKRLGLAPNLALFDSAANNQDSERMGTGAIQMGLTSSNPNLTALLSEQRKGKAQQDAAGGLERAFSLRNAEVRGSALPLIGLGQSRNATTLGALGGMYGHASQGYQNAQSNYLDQASRPGFWSQLALAGIGAGGAAAGAYLGRSRR
jgi:hypothetical protein